ncbi:hypothetical protein Rsub_12154 [Raphidocelis subcapitata]|uniref:SAP domain-containing protein n=1 Tax=Raphidocelis subcapitata TaxID=307507 RepID=A0A2V0PID5_9CHLO|nr:hypothetical protein Rsub_12154 [Raphidocelis subcapitata]|eukprot:GBF99486.1 hypothetical protein Rsub_12154 [Raphidocelis subcapitata]
MTPYDIERVLRGVMLKDLRVYARAHGLSPAGGKEQLADRIKAHMLESGDCTFITDTGEVLMTSEMVAGTSNADVAHGYAVNNYARPEGQNVGNHLSDRNSSRVLAPPGGKSSFIFGDASTATPPPAMSPAPAAPPRTAEYAESLYHAQSPAPYAVGPPAPPPGSLAAGADAKPNNNYERAGGQNTGNFLTSRKMVRVAAPPGGASSIVFG